MSTTYTNTITFKINKTDVPERYLVLNDSTSLLKITLKTNGFNLLKYYFKKPKIDINFSENIEMSKEYYIWNKHQGFSDLNHQFNKDIEIISITPDTLKFRFDVNAIKKVPVKLNSKLSFTTGFDLLDSIKISPDSVKIIGPEILVSEIAFIETDTLSLKDIKANVDKTVSLNLPNNKNNNLIFSDSKVGIHAEVDKFTEGHLKIPITVINIPDSLQIKYFPKKLYVTYYTSLSNYNKITANDFMVTCDFNQIEKESEFLIPQIVTQPNEVKHVKLSQEQIEFIIIE
ncbi:CdaR family protein [Xanthomarina sp. GH4-25]|uniref:CdaR family protein n=1 Tax=Xanthomarina sp. GH4-25 TaxID=3349335 RepID=UPI003877CB9B